MDDILDNSYFKNTIKHKYSFPKTNRFPDIKPKSNADFIESASINTQRSTSFGYGSKYDFFKEKHRSPSPFQYSVNDKMKSSQTISFGVGRDRVKANSYIDSEKGKTPMAGKYENNAINFHKKEPSYVMRSRHPEDSFIKITHNPEAGKYNPNDTFHSLRKRSSQFAFGSSERFDYGSKEKSVGPGSYASHQQKTHHGTIGHAKRKTFAVQELQKSITPGPKYILP